MLFPEGGAGEHLFGALHRKFGHAAAHDMRNLPDALLRAQFVHERNGAIIEDLLVNAVVSIGEGSDLRQVRDANDLVIARKLPELLAHDLTAAPADTSIDLIKDEGGRGISISEDGFEREHEARSLAAGSNLRERLEGFAGVGRDEKLHAVNARQVAGVILFGLAVEAGGNALLIGNLHNLDQEAGAAHIEIVELLFHRRCEALRGLAAPF